jgi:predicted RNA-binding Zn-ribbon protein involved in translation (DUF1610 family)
LNLTAAIKSSEGLLSISFQCSQCGKKLKAPDSAAGRSSSCPGCGGTVTCPEPEDDGEVVEMQLTPVKPKGFDPFAEVDDGKPYGVSAGGPASEAGGENRRPCPMCGEMIVATAAKCRFCGEVFDPTIKRVGKPKSGKGKKKAQLRRVALYQRFVLYCILAQVLGFIAYIGIFMVFKPDPRPGGAGVAIAGVFMIAMVLLWLASIVFAFLLSMELSNIGLALLALVSTFCAGLIALLVINVIATRRLRDAGIDVGFLGAYMSHFS